jgi:hypothetical protein
VYALVKHACSDIAERLLLAIVHIPWLGGCVCASAHLGVCAIIEMSICMLQYVTRRVLRKKNIYTPGVDCSIPMVQCLARGQRQQHHQSSTAPTRFCSSRPSLAA